MAAVGLQGLEFRQVRGTRNRLKLGCVTVLLGLCFAGNGFAQASGPPAGGSTANPTLANPASQIPPADQRRASRSVRDMLSAPEAGPCPLASSQLTFDLVGVDVSGAEVQGGSATNKTSVVTEAELRSTYSGLIGKNVPVAEICGVRDRIAKLIFDKGIFARVEIPAQTIADGQVRIEVTLARIGSVKVLGAAGKVQNLVENYLSQLQGRPTFSLIDAQRLLLLSDDIPGVNVAATLRAAREGRGVIDLEVRVERDPIDIVGNSQNFGSKALGPEAVLARVDFNSYTSFGERTSFVLFSTVDGKEQVVAQALGEARFGSRGLVGDWSVAYAETKPGGDAALLSLEGTSVVAKFGARYPWLRSRRQNIVLSGGLEYAKQEVNSGTFRLTDDTMTIIYARADADRSFDTRFPIRARAGLELRQGLTEASKTPSRFDGKGNALVVRSDYSAEVLLSPRVSAQVSGDLQYTDSPLLAYEEIAMGNLTAGRGYDPSSISGDTGATARFELRGGPFNSEVGAFSGYLFYDVGQVDNLDRAGEKITAASSGFGIRYRLSDQFDLDLAYAAPLDKVSVFAESKPKARVLFNLISKFR